MDYDVNRSPFFTILRVGFEAIVKNMRVAEFHCERRV